jgi:hypothetical protein
MASTSPAAGPDDRGPDVRGSDVRGSDVGEFDTDLPTAGEGGDHGAQRSCRPAASADDLPDIVGVNADLQNPTTTLNPVGYLDVVRMGDDPPDQVLDGLAEHAAQCPAS